MNHSNRRVFLIHALAGTSALATAAAKRRGIYISHIRDEADRTIEAVRETIEIGMAMRPITKRVT